MTNNQRVEAIAKAEDLNNLLDHIAWKEAVKPILLKKRNELTTLLVQVVLGAHIQAPGGQPLGKEELAGRIYGIDEIIRVFEKILKDGEKALDDLNSQGIKFNISKPDSNIV